MKKTYISRGILAALFTFFMVFGSSFAKYDSWYGVFGSTQAGFLSAVWAAAWFLLFFFLITAFFRFLDRFPIRQDSNLPAAGRNKGEASRAYQILSRNRRHTQDNQKRHSIFTAYRKLFQDRPVLASFCTLMAVSLPYMILSYPGIFMGDTDSQMWQIIPEEPNLVSHHPFAHTLVLGFFVNLGFFFQNQNLGIFLYCFTQAALLCLMEAFSLGTLMNLQVNKKLVICILVYYAVHPVISAYLFLVSKDVYFAVFFLMFYIFLYYVFFSGCAAGKNHGLPAHPEDINYRKLSVYTLFLRSQGINSGIPFGYYILLGVAAAGMILFRNEGRYIVLATLLLCLSRKKFRRKALAYLVVSAAVALTMDGIICPALGVTPGSKAEMLSIPFQQTARYVRDAGEEVTEEEQQVIGQVLAYDKLAENYDPNISDPVKGSYKGDDSALGDYFRVWFSMFWKHPGIYLQATMNNYYQYFYPGSRVEKLYSYEYSAECMDWVNRDLQTAYAYPHSLNELRSGFEALREKVFSLPVLRLSKTPAFYIWIMLLCVFYCVDKCSFDGFLLCVPMLVHMLVMISGPTNGYYGRYEFPMFVYLPVAVSLVLLTHNRRHTDCRSAP